MTDYTKHLAQPTPAMPGPAPLPGMVPGSSGPATWPVDEWVRLDRFLILGHDGGSYYASERTMTLDTAKTIHACLLADPTRTVRRIAEISRSGRAPKNDPAIFALAVCAAHSLETRRLALAALPEVCRIGTHLFHFLRDYEALRPAGSADKAQGRYGRQVRRALSAWYQAKPIDRLAYDLVKYRQRDGWAHRDVLRLAHPRWRVPAEKALYQWVAKGYQAEHPTAADLPSLVRAAEAITVVPGAKPSEAFIGTAINAIREHRLPWEAVAPELRSEPGIWRALLPHMPYEATVRNLGAMTRNGALVAAGQPELAQVVERLTSREQIHRARFHPIKALVALRTYASGQPVRGRGEGWTPIRDLVAALDAVFYAAFEATLDPRPGKVIIALDVSGSMGGGQVAGIPGLTPRNASAALALVFMRQFPDHEIVGFSASGTRLGVAGRGGYYRDGVSRLPLTPTMRLDQAEAVVSGLDFGATDCSLAMRWAQKNKIAADAFIVLTDSETNSHSVHPSRALQAYRQQAGRATKLIVVAMVSNGFSIADPKDAGMLDVVGFDTHVPTLITDFIAPVASAPSPEE